VDKFTTDKIGTGEGAQAYGWGLYFAKARAVAEEYRKTLSTTITVGGKQLLKNNQKITSTGDSYVDNLLIAHDGDLESAIASERVYADSMAAQSKQSRKTATGDPYEILNKLIALQQKQSVEVQTTGNLYTVELLPDEADFLDWDKPLSEQSEKVKAALYSAYEARGVDTQQENFGWQSGQMAYKAMMDEGARKEQRKLPPSKRNNGSLEKQASEYLASLGIPGIRYLDGQSRGSGEGTHNYVIFDENLVKIIEENGKPVGESPAIKRFQPVSPEQDAGIFEQKGLENHVLKPILGAAFTFNPKKINEKYIKQAKEVADRLGGGSAFNPSRKSGDDGQARVQMDGLRSSELRTKQEIDARILQDSPNGVIKEGGEHFSFIPDNKDYVIKVTKPSETGTSGFIVDEYVAPGFDQKQFRFLNFRRASVSEYVARTALFSKLFNIPWQVVEVAQDADGQPVIYSMMKKIEGERLKDTSPSDRNAVEKLMESKGFKFLGDSYLTFRKGSEPLEGITFFNAKTGVLISDAEPRNFVRTPSGKIEPVDLMINVFPTEYNIRFQPDSASPSILNGSNGTRIIKSPSGKFRVYSATGALLGIRDTEEAAKKLATK
jgi:hypothetical protein